MQTVERKLGEWWEKIRNRMTLFESFELGKRDYSSFEEYHDMNYAPMDQWTKQNVVELFAAVDNSNRNNLMNSVKEFVDDNKENNRSEIENLNRWLEKKIKQKEQLEKDKLQLIENINEAMKTLKTLNDDIAEFTVAPLENKLTDSNKNGDLNKSEPSKEPTEEKEIKSNKESYQFEEIIAKIRTSKEKLRPFLNEKFEELKDILNGLKLLDKEMNEKVKELEDILAELKQLEKEKMDDIKKNTNCTFTVDRNSNT